MVIRPQIECIYMSTLSLEPMFSHSSRCLKQCVYLFFRSLSFCLYFCNDDLAYALPAF
jgi:hypothetical protein